MASINPYNIILGILIAKHLLRRATFNFSKTQPDALVEMTALQAVDSLKTSPESTSPDICLGHLSQGAYMLQIKSENNTETYKIINNLML